MTTVRRSRGNVPLAVTLVMGGLFVVAASLGHVRGGWGFLGWWSGAPDIAPAMSPSRPSSLEIPAIGVYTDVNPVSLDADGAIAAPPLDRAHEVGWYADGPSPGQEGPAILVGHVDDRSGPAVFHDLDSLLPGDRVEVTRQDGRVAVFEVTDVRQYDKEYLPPEEVFAAAKGRAELRLITCGGQWVGGDVGYSDNVVVFAVLVDSR